jgi:hypothetical protein
MESWQFVISEHFGLLLALLGAQTVEIDDHDDQDAGDDALPKRVYVQ